MILYYALGGGLGHLTRARQVLAALDEDDAALLTASRFARDPRVTGALPVIDVPPPLGHDPAGFRRWLADTLAALRPDGLIVDSFPGGILGELCGMTLPPARHVARRLRWTAYEARLDGPLPRYEVAYTLEPLEPRHVEELTDCACRIEPLTLPAAAWSDTPLADEPHWLVVHSGPDAEVVELAERAAELRVDGTLILVVSPRRPSRLPARAEWRDMYPVGPYLTHAEGIVTAAGFNAMHETAELRARHCAVPFARPLDDQFARA